MSYLSISQAAKILGVSTKTLMRWDNSKKFPAKREKVSGARYYDEKDIHNHALWFKIRRKDKAHNKKLTAIKKEADRFSAAVPLSLHSDSPKHRDFKSMKEAYENLRGWEKEHKNIQAMYSKLPKGFVGKVDPES